VRPQLLSCGRSRPAALNEEEAARALRELRKQGCDKPIVGETVLTSQKVIELAGEAANGAVAHVGLTADAPDPGIRAFTAKFQKEYNYKPDHNGLKGYSGMYIYHARAVAGHRRHFLDAR
jgi:branched-chain amino acid transport system substrate-binding protein